MAVLMQRTQRQQTDKSMLCALLSGAGQLVFIGQPRVGVLVLLGILVNSPLMLFAALTGGLGATLVGWYLMERSAFHLGLAGFNGYLLGLAAVLFMQPSGLLWLLVFLGGGLAAWVFNEAMRRQLPLLTAPYIVLMLLLWWCLPVLPVPDGGAQWHWPMMPIISGTLTGVGQMGFQGNLLSFAFMLAGLLLGATPTTACWALFGSGFGAVAGLIAGVDERAVAIGLCSYNCVLIAVALTHVSGYRRRSWQLWLAMVTCAMLTVTALKLALFPLLTIPFVLSMWLIMLLERGWRLSQN